MHPNREILFGRATNVCGVSVAVALAASALGRAAESPAIQEDYNQWKQALHAPATAATNISAPTGFQVELLRAARPHEGSWVSFAFDPRGRIVIAREDRGLLRLTFPGRSGADFRIETINTNLLECRGLLFAFDSLYANANNSKALCRLRDTDGDDQFDEVKLLKTTGGGVGHGRNDLVLGPDNFLYLIHGDDVRLPDNGAGTASPFQPYSLDRLLPCDWDKPLYASAAPSPGGHVIRTDRDGRTWELLAGGLRNPFGIDFNPDGEMFTYDADLEWDIGLPWYHPTRVLHLVPSADYGWRRSTANLQVWLPDTRPSVADIGKGSPTAIRFGTRSHFPPAWRRALFILDWAYGRILAVHLTPQGASYTGRAEVFLQGRPLNVTDLEFGPDGALYFVTGGRKTQSGLYRVRYVGPRVPEAPLTKQALARERAAAEARALRRRLEALQRQGESTAVAFAWPHLGSEDDWIRHAARVAIERQPVSTWQERALKEARPAAAPTALLALARTGPPDVRDKILQRLDKLPLDRLSADEKVIALRTFAVCFIRFGKPDNATVAEASARLEVLYPDRDSRVNQQLCELLVYLDSARVVSKTLPLLAVATTQSEKLHYLFMLRLVKSGWSLTERQAYFRALAAARDFVGTHYLPLVLKYIQADAFNTLTQAERASLADTLAALQKVSPPAAFAPVDPTRRFVREWRLADLVDSLAAVGSKRDLRRGKAMFAVAGCKQCHQLAGEGSAVGPELTGVAGRFSRRDLLEAILEPSKVIAENYRNVTITTKAGTIMVGRILGEDEGSVTLAVNPTDPDNRWGVRKKDIAAQLVSDVSPMPAGLLDTLTRDEILDLLAWLEFGGGAAVTK